MKNWVPCLCMHPNPPLSLYTRLLMVSLQSLRKRPNRGTPCDRLPTHPARPRNPIDQSQTQVAIAQDRPDNILESIRFDTTTPEETFGKIKVRSFIGWPAHYHAWHVLVVVSVNSYGPLIIRALSHTNTHSRSGSRAASMTRWASRPLGLWTPSSPPRPTATSPPRPSPGGRQASALLDGCC